MEKGIWLEIEELYKEFQQLGISQSVDYEKYYLYSLITHSTAIEGSTLTEMDAQLLFDEGVTAKGKPLVYHLMNEDLKKAYELAKKVRREMSTESSHAVASSLTRLFCTEISESLSLEKSCAATSVVKLIKITAKMALKICLKRFTMQKYLIIFNYPSFF